MKTLSQDAAVTIDNELDIDLLAFVERYASTPVHWDLVTFFGIEPQRQASADAIARRMSWPPAVLHRELDELVVLGLLEQVNTNGSPQYRLTGYKPLRDAALHFAARLDQSTASTDQYPS